MKRILRGKRSRCFECSNATAWKLKRLPRSDVVSAAYLQICGIDCPKFVNWSATISLLKQLLAHKWEDERLHFHAEDLLKTDDYFDLLLIMDVIEHVPDYFGFVDRCRQKAKFKIYHIPLDIHASSVVRKSLMYPRKVVGHIHYFTAESALATLLDTGHKILDSFYTSGGIELASIHPSFKRRLANIPRRIISCVSPGLAARLLGGFSLLVLAE